MADTCTTSGPFGVFPDCEGLGASVFLNCVYGYALLTAAGFISDGSELLLEILSPGLVGGLLLPTAPAPSSDVSNLLPAPVSIAHLDLMQYPPTVSVPAFSMLEPFGSALLSGSKSLESRGGTLLSGLAGTWTAIRFGVKDYGVLWCGDQPHCL